MADRPVIYSIGHSNQSFESFAVLLARAGIELLVDLRARPASRFAAWANKKNLPGKLKPLGIEHVWMGDSIGGWAMSEVPDHPLTRADFASREMDPEFIAGIDRLAALAREKRTAMMCSEEDPARCHRRLLITPALLARGFNVLHIRRDGSIINEVQYQGFAF